MKLYYVKTMFQFLCAITDKMIKNPNESAVIMINSFIRKRVINSTLLETFFHFNVIEYDTNLITKNTTADKNTFINDISKYYDKLFENNKYSIDEFDEIHVFAALRFSLYLCLNKINFYLHEDGNGAASKNGFVQWREETDKVNKRELATDYRLLDASNKFIIKAYCRKESQTVRLTSKTDNFDICEKLSCLSQDTISNLIKLFTNQNLTDNHNPSIILTQYYFEDKSVEYNNFSRAHLYLNLANYFAPSGQVYIKPHPADYVNYNNYFDVEIIDKYLPSELLLSYNKLRFNYCITVSSTSIEAMKKISDNTLIIGNNINWIIKYGDMLQAIIYLYQERFSNYKFMHFGIFNNDINRLLKKNNLSDSCWYYDSDNPKFIVVCDRTWGKNKLNLNIKQNDLVILLNPNEWNDVIPNYYNSYVLSIKISKFFSKAVILCGSSKEEVLLENFHIKRKQNIDTLFIDIYCNIDKRLKQLEKIINLQNEELNILKKYIINN